MVTRICILKKERGRGQGEGEGEIEIECVYAGLFEGPSSLRVEKI